jgi:translation initiation factor IF-2
VEGVSKIRVYELAKELGLSNKEVTERLAKAGFSVTSASSSVDEGKARAALAKGAPKEKAPKRVTKAEAPAKAKPAERVKGAVEAKPSPEPKVTPKPTPPPAKAAPQAAKPAPPAAKPAPEVRPKVKVTPVEEKARKTPVVPPPVPEAPPAPPRREVPPPAPKREAPPAPRVHPEPPRVDAPRTARPVAEKPAPVVEKKPPIAEKKPPVVPKPAPVAERPTPAAAKPTVAPVEAPPRPPEAGPPVSPPAPKVIKIPETITVKELCGKLATSPSEIIKKLMKMGIIATVNQNLSPNQVKQVAATLGFEVEMARVEEVEEAAAEVEDPSQLRPRPPVVTVMGHVDHGKTSLLDAIRKTNVIAEEVGGITQHIGAYEVELPPDPGTKFPGGRVVFLDTPGHEAFTAMRARGAHVTDVVVLVVAADDGVMPQTIEAINHAKDAKVPILVAINKIDKAGADPNRVKQQLSEHGLIPEEWGGQTIFVEVSAKKRTGIEHLLEMLLLQAEIMELKANPFKPARGLAIEAKLDRGRGAVATVLVQQGTLKVGDVFVVGNIHGRVRALINDKARKVQEAGPSTPVEVLGLSGVPAAGDTLVVVADERKARQVALVRQQQQRDTTFAAQRRLTLEDLHRRIKEGEVKELRLLLKGDVQGSIEPLKESLERLSAPEVQLKVIHAAVGGISESDVMLASASNAIILGFTVRPDPKAQRLAETMGVDIRLYNVIYDAVAEIKEAMEGMLEPQFAERPMGRAEVRATFGVPRFGTVAGCFVNEGKVTRDAAVRLVRDGRVVHQGKIASLRRFKEDVREVQNGYECGIGLLNFSDIKVGDLIEVYELVPVAAKLQPSLS